MLFDSTFTWNKQEWSVDETVQGLINTNQIKDCIVVGVPNGGPLRPTEYFPQKPFESLPRNFQDSLLALPLFAEKAQSDAYLKFLVALPVYPPIGSALLRSKIIPSQKLS
ncbi:MAG: hypothetical protein Sapg2KO_06430 [Saprospiraceae bacterium]